MMKVKILITIFLVAWTSQVWAQFWIEPAVNFGTTRLEWGPVSIKASKPSWEVQGGITQRGNIFPVSIWGSRTSAVRQPRELVPDTPFTVNGQTFGKKNGQTKGQAQAGKGAQETVVFDAQISRGMVGAVYQRQFPLFPAFRLEYLNVSLTARGKVEGKQVEVSESITRYYPQIGLAYAHREGAASMTLLGTVGQRSSHLEANLSWNIRPDVWIGIGGKRDYMGFEQGRAESAAFTVKAGMAF